ncbi:Exonuclease domain-containing protein [Mycena kentingensis (nom. inval.)]|nr:Exonuclease domain-containing protein [Mycena kentingensis (nom. inval.)]
MFSKRQLFQVACPDRACSRPSCLYTHREGLPRPLPLVIPIEQQPPVPTTSQPALVPAKRSVSSPSTSFDVSVEPPRKTLKAAPNRAVPVAPQPTSSGPPVLRVSGAQSTVPLPVRQALLKSLFDHFVVVYQDLLASNPSIASEHALKQEAEIYERSTKQTYRNAVIQCCAAIKRRVIPDSVSHASVGTELGIAERAAALKTRKSLRLTRSNVEHLILSREDLETWGYIVEIPEGIGGIEPSRQDKLEKCDRCGKAFQVKRRDEAEECFYHWGKPWSRSSGGQKVRVYRCCSKPVGGDDDGCVHGPHVFYEKEASKLHARHAFSRLQLPSSSRQTLDVAALDCEMIYTTGGMRVARVSVVDGNGGEVYDKLICMDEGVDVIDFNTRFSGITEEEYKKAMLPLSAIRGELDAFLDQETVLIGHGLENDLHTLRIVHHKNVDTAIMFKHPAGPPYRKALRDLAREHLGTLIQSGGGSTGHSSMEDVIATLDLVRWHVINRPVVGAKQ